MAFPQSDTICALATPPGIGGIGVFRISGPDAFAFCDQILRHQKRCALHPGYTLHRANVMDGSEVIDDALVSIFHAPRSYTGENVVELSCHGGPVVLGRVLGRLLTAGARHADPGEFTLRAYLNGKMDLAQAEAVGDIVAAKTENGLRLARSQQSGRLSQAILAVRERILGVLARVEASIDFPEDVGDLDETTCRMELQGASEALTMLMASASRGILTRQGARVALAGLPNAGKSSLMNALLQTNRSLVTAIPGTTRDMIEETFSVRGIPIRLQDTAGLRETDDLVEQLGVERTRETIAAADLVVYVVDGTLGMTLRDRETLRDFGRPTLLIWNKCDRGDALPPHPGAITISAVTGMGMESLESEILGALVGGQAAFQEDAPCITHTRHLNAVRETRECIEQSLITLKVRLPADLIAVDLYRALTTLGAVTGQTAQEDVIIEIFSRFCIGK